ncbi:MAG: MtrB/PioB family decaheme-associated outer membrane protein [Magnetococcales bacterium]|nr:MtrB/PioB family decaheme-associated outer membrane protein [Magnetococcales bacterium]
MNTTQCRFVTRRNTVLALSAIFVGLSLASVAQAEQRLEGEDALDKLTKPVSKVEFGVGNVTRNSLAGDYTGLGDKGAYAIGSLDLRGGDAYDSGGTQRWRIRGESLGLDSRRIDAEYGEQGKYKVRASFDDIPKMRSDTYQTPFNGVGGNNLTLPVGWVANVGAPTTATTNAASMNLSGMHNVQIGTDRKKGEGGVSVNITPEVEFSAGYKEENKDGTKITGGITGSSSSYASTLLPEPVNYNTRQFDANLSYNTKKGQFQLGYYGSLFENKNKALDWQNPWATNAGTGVVGGIAQGQMGLAPDNQFHQFNASGGYNFDKNTRLTVNASRGVGTQDQTFLPYVISPTNVTGSVITGGPLGLNLPTTSLSGEVVTTNLYTKLTARPIDKLNVAASYKYDDRDNQTASKAYYGILNDGASLVPDSYTPGYQLSQYNIARDVKKQTGTLEADYTFLPRTAVKLGYDFQEIDRTYSETDETKENTFRIGLRSTSVESGFAGGIGYLHAERTQSNYTYFATDSALAGGFSPGSVGQQKYMFANRDRDKVHANVSYTPPALAKLTLQADVGINHDDYSKSLFGMIDDRGWNTTLDATYAFSEVFAASAFYTHENTKADQLVPASGATITLPLAYGYKLTDETDTFGVGVKDKGLMDGRLELGGNASVVLAKTQYDERNVNGYNTPVLPLPEITSHAYTLGVNGRYEVSKNSAVKASYVWQKLTSADWGTQGIQNTTVSGVLPDGEQAPNYTVQFLGISYQHTFW